MLTKLAVILSLLSGDLVSTQCIQTTETHYRNNDNYGRMYYQQTIENICTCSNITLPFSDERCSSNLMTLNIISLQTKTIPVLAFGHHNNIGILHMENLHIQQISSGAFTSLDQLTELYLSNNSIGEITDGVLNSIIKLEILDLSQNNIKHVTQHFLTGTKYLKTLNFSSNFLTSFDTSFLYSIQPISIDISFNSLSSFNFNNTISFIEFLNVSHNNISDVSGCWSNYENVYLRQNQLRLFPNMNCSWSERDFKLTLLDMGQNSISELPQVSNQTINSLQFLILDRNEISNIPQRFSEDFPSLTHLNLSFNHLTKLEYGAFDDFDKLFHLDLSHNKLTNIRRYTHPLASLQTLNLENNKLEYLDGRQLINDMPMLRTIYLDQNYLSCDGLVEVINTFKLVQKNVAFGHTTDSANIRGIACLEDSSILELNKKFESLISKNLSALLGNNTSMYEYFNRDFRKSNFYKYLESMQQSSLRLNETELVNYFNKDFKNSMFYEYLESFRNQNIPVNLSKSFFDYFNKDFRNSSFVKYLDDLREADYTFHDGFNRSLMYSFFNKNFRDSNFYKYLENLRQGENKIDDVEKINIEKALLEFNRNNYSVILYLIFIVLLLIASALIFLVIFVLRFHYPFSKHCDSSNETVELCEK